MSNEFDATNPFASSEVGNAPARSIDEIKNKQPFWTWHMYIAVAAAIIAMTYTIRRAIVFPDEQSGPFPPVAIAAVFSLVFIFFLTMLRDFPRIKTILTIAMLSVPIGVMFVYMWNTYVALATST